MRLCAPIAAALLATAMAGCILQKKPPAVVAAPPPPPVAVVVPTPEPLSIPQTRVKLPPAQPLNPEALTLAPRPETPPPVPAPAQPAVPAARRAPAAPNPPPAKPDAPPPASSEPARPSIQEVLPEGARNQLQETAAAKQKRIRAWLDSTAAQGLTGQPKLTRDRIQNFLKASGDAEHRGDIREAVQLAERAEILIQELQGGR